MLLLQQLIEQKTQILLQIFAFLSPKFLHLFFREILAFFTSERNKKMHEKTLVQISSGT